MNRKFETEQLLYTQPEVAELLRTNRARVYALTKKGILRTIKCGREKVTKKALDDFLELTDGNNVDELLARIPDGWTLDDLIQSGVFGEKAKKSGLTNADLKKFLSEGTAQQQPTRTNTPNMVSPYPSFLSNLNHRKGPLPVYSNAELKRMAQKGLI